MCTSFQLRGVDGSVCVARTMEFPDMLGARLTVLPRGLTLTSDFTGDAARQLELAPREFRPVAI